MAIFSYGYSCYWKWSCSCGICGCCVCSCHMSSVICLPALCIKLGILYCSYSIHSTASANQAAPNWQCCPSCPSSSISANFITLQPVSDTHISNPRLLLFHLKLSINHSSPYRDAPFHISPALITPLIPTKMRKRHLWSLWCLL